MIGDTLALGRHTLTSKSEDMAMKPNILIFMTDQQRGDSISPYGKAKTPNLDKFCHEGIVFSEAYTASPHCCPSRATFFSGLYPSQHGVWNNVSIGNAISRGLYDGVRLWSEDMKDAGYDLYFHGKWHVSSLEGPEHRGFQVAGATEPRKTYQHARPSTAEWKGYDRIASGSRERKEGEIIRAGYPSYIHYGTEDNPFNDDNVVNEAIDGIRNRKAGSPWVRYVGTLGPHDPYFVPQKYLDMYSLDDMKLPDSFNDKMLDKPAFYRKTRDRFDRLSEQEHKEATRHYLAFCTYEDALFGRIIEALDQSGEADNTLVIYTSDHGDYMGEHGLWTKGLPCFRGAYHVPLAMRWPTGLVQPARVENAFVTLADFAPTFLELAEVGEERSFSGMSLVPFLRNEQPAEWRDAVFTQTNGNEQYGIQRSIMTKEWKLVHNGFDYEELYDLHNDPGETRNLYGDPQYDEVVKTLFTRLWGFARSVDDVCVNAYIMTALAPHGPGVIYD